MYPSKLLLHYEYLCCMMDQCCKFRPDPLLASSIITTQSLYISFWFKKLTGSHFFLYFLHSHCTPLHGFAVCGLTYSACLFSSYLSHALLDVSETCYILYLMHTLQAWQFTDYNSYFRGYFTWQGKRFHNSYLSRHLFFNSLGKTNILMYTMMLQFYSKRFWVMLSF